MFQGLFDLEDQGQSHQFSNLSETFMWTMHGSSLKVKIQSNSKVTVFTRNHTDDKDDETMMKLEKNMSPPGGGDT